MRVAIVCLPAGRGEKLSLVAQGLAKGLEAKGHRVELLDPKAEPLGIAGFEYIVVGTESQGPWGKVPQGLRDYLGRCQGLGGKRAFAFALKSGLRPQKLLASLMARMEAEGLRITFSELLSSEAEGIAAGKEAPVERA